MRLLRAGVAVAGGIVRPIRRVVLAPGAVSALGLTDMPALEQSGLRLYGTNGGRLEIRGTSFALRHLLRRAWTLVKAGQRPDELPGDYGARTRSIKAASSRIAQALSTPCRPPISRRAIAAVIEAMAEETDYVLEQLAAGMIPAADVRDAMADRATNARQLASRLRSKGG